MAQKRLQRMDVDTSNIMAAGRSRKSIKYSDYFEDNGEEDES